MVLFDIRYLMFDIWGGAIPGLLQPAFGSNIKYPISNVTNYPLVKLLVNRVVNKLIQIMFWTKFNDLSNAFKIYRAEVIESCGPFRACHFNITLELSLGALIRQYDIAQIPINWEGRTWGCSNLRLKEMGRKYLCTLLMIYFQKLLIVLIMIPLLLINRI